ncbi:chemotaxis protein CheW [Aliivibrio kagoshimensis]|uniref:chemotaxis protein CheW n=1 Tax=Aliivibrio kagoshimensis TaxID=2910230 RepID=UPI003D0E05E9
MMNSERMSGEQALDSYFLSLFDEGVVETPEPLSDLEPTHVTERVEDPIAEPTVQSQPLVKSIAETPKGTVFSEAPELKNVQQLLNQLKNVEPNTQQDNETTAKIEVIELSEASIDKVELTQEVEEIQEWVVESPPEALVQVEEQVEIIAKGVIETEVELHVEPELETLTDSPLEWEQTEVGDEFQLLFFIVNGMTFAVQLAELGGIHEKTELNHLIGRPTWYLGMQTANENKYHVVDTAKWVMPEKLNDEKYQEEYRYIVLLGDSNWGLACNQLVGTESITNEQIRWRETAGKRPWLAGMVKEKMCALIHVEALVAMLNAGLDIKGMDCEQKG